MSPPPRRSFRRLSSVRCGCCWGESTPLPLSRYIRAATELGSAEGGDCREGADRKLLPYIKHLQLLVQRDNRGAIAHIVSFVVTNLRHPRRCEETCMDAGTHSLKVIFGQDRRHLVPLFQRPYVWTEQVQWAPF